MKLVGRWLLVVSMAWPLAARVAAQGDDSFPLTGTVVNPAGRPVELSQFEFFRYFAAQAAIQAFSIPIRLVSLLFFAWAYAFFQNVTVLSFTQDYGRQPLRNLFIQSARLAHRGWGQNHLLILVMLVIGLFTLLLLLTAPSWRLPSSFDS